MCHEGSRLHNGLRPCFTRDEGRPLGTALQGEVPNHRKRLRTKALVVSVTVKARPDLAKVRVLELKDLNRCKSVERTSDVIKTRAGSVLWDKSGECLLIGQTVTGMKAAGTRHRLW